MIGTVTKYYYFSPKFLLKYSTDRNYIFRSFEIFIKCSHFRHTTWCFTWHAIRHFWPMGCKLSPDISRTERIKYSILTSFGFYIVCKRKWYISLKTSPKVLNTEKSCTSFCIALQIQVTAQRQVVIYLFIKALSKTDRSCSVVRILPGIGTHWDSPNFSTRLVAFFSALTPQKRNLNKLMASKNSGHGV